MRKHFYEFSWICSTLLVYYVVVSLSYYVLSMSDIWKDDGHEKTLTVQVTEQILSWNPREKLIKGEPVTWECSRTLARICVACIWDFGERLRKRLVKRSDAKRKRTPWQQREQIAQDEEWDIVGLWSRRSNSYKHK